MADTPLDADALGGELTGLIRELYPICRSITGDGLRQTLAILQRYVPLVLSEVPSGTAVLDWVVPREWNIKDAWIKNAAGERVVDFRASNLHVVNYSVPVAGVFQLSELRPHLHTLPQQPDAIPYRTTYYEESWGFCLSQRQLDALPEAAYEVCIDSTLAPGSLTYGELLLPGSSREEILISTHVCHPSLCDDNLSGVVVALFLARALAQQSERRYSVRFLFAPGTIGAITWLARNESRASLVKHGLTLTCLGDEHPFTFKKTFAGEHEIDRMVASVLKTSGYPHKLVDFFPYGYDERQYNSPGFRLPVGSLMRGRHGSFPEYHTSLDNLGFVSAPRLTESYRVLHDVVQALQRNVYYRNLQPYGEPQLGKRGLYRAMGGTGLPGLQFAMLWVLSMADGQKSLLDMSERSGIALNDLHVAADLLVEHQLLARVERPEPTVGN
jgi:aminopeptidase-like protein